MDNVFITANSIGLKETAWSVLGIRINAGGTMPCPIHHETNGRAFSVRDNKFWTCFGKCGKHGDNIELVSVMNNISRYEAAKLICDTFKLAFEVKKVEGATSAPPVDFSFLLGNDFLAECSNVILKANASVMDYLTVKRGFSVATIDAYKFGYMTQDYYDKLLPSVKAGKVSQANYDSFKRHLNRLIIPLFNSSGKQILGFVSRSLSPADKIKYINDEDSSFAHGYHKRVYTFGMPQSTKKSVVTIVEGYFDAPSFRQLGVNSVAMGDCSMPEPRFKYLVDVYSMLILGLDNDTTGVYRTFELFKKYNHVNFHFVLWPKDIKDANDALLKNVIPNYGDFFEYVKNVWENDINDIQTVYENRLDFIAKLRDCLSSISYGSEHYFVKVEIDKKIEELLS